MRIALILAAATLTLAAGLKGHAITFLRPLRSRATMIAAAVALIIGVAVSTATACTRILWNDNSVSVVSARSADWVGSSQPGLLVLPRGMRKSGAFLGSRRMVVQNPARWTSRYGSAVTSNYGTTVVDGMNERGLAAHAMWLKGTDYGARDASRPGLHAALWVQYILDNAATVDQALSIAGRIQPVPADLNGVNLPLAFGIEDRTGDSAIIEYLGGQPVIHHGREYRVMANTPMDQALAILGTFDFTGATRNVPLPGNTNSVDRFVRASFYSAFLSRTTPRNRLEAMAYGMSVARNVSDPIGAPGDAVGETHETDYRTVADLTHGVYVFESTRGLATLRTDLRRIDFRQGSGARSINPINPRLQGDVTSLYRPSRISPPGARP